MAQQDQTEPDARVAAAAAHWSYRFISNGTDYGDFTATLSRITRWDDWCREWGNTAAEYEQLAESAEDAGQRETAAGAWRRAALAWHWGKFVFVDHPDEQRAAHDRSVACYRRAAGSLTPPAELVRIPYAGTQLPAYLRVPAGPRPPVVIMVPGLDSTKEELQATAEYYLARGLATIAIDGPGQGESEYELPIEPAYEKVATAAVDYLRTREDVDGEKTGLFGVSLGGYYAARAAAYEPRLAAVVSLAGPYRFDLDWDEPARADQGDLPGPLRRGERGRQRGRRPPSSPSRTPPAASASRCSWWAAAETGSCPPYHQERLAKEAPGAELLLYPDGSHGVTNRAYESRSRMADWLAGHLTKA